MTTPMYAKGTTLDLSIYPSFIQYATSVGYPKGNDNRCHKIYDDWYARGTVVWLLKILDNSNQLRYASVYDCSVSSEMHKIYKELIFSK